MWGGGGRGRVERAGQRFREYSVEVRGGGGGVGGGGGGGGGGGTRLTY